MYDFEWQGNTVTGHITQRELGYLEITDWSGDTSIVREDESNLNIPDYLKTVLGAERIESGNKHHTVYVVKNHPLHSQAVVVDTKLIAPFGTLVDWVVEKVDQGLQVVYIIKIRDYNPHLY